MSDVSLSLSVEEVNAILSVLGDLPSKTGAWPLILKIKSQAENGVKSSAQVVIDEAQELSDRID